MRLSKKILFLLISMINLYSNTIKTASNCTIDYSIMELYALNERSIHRDVGYPYLISFNSFVIPNELSNKYVFKKIDIRTIDCLNSDNCVKILKNLIKNKNHNIDLGAFQANYKWFKFPLHEYFNLNTSYYNACMRVDELITKYGLSWETLAYYHSFTEDRNKKYRESLKKHNKNRGKNI